MNLQQGLPWDALPSLAVVTGVEFYSCHLGALWAVRNSAQPGITPWLHLPFLVWNWEQQTGLGSAEPACCEPWAGEGVLLSKVQTGDSVPF